MENYFFRFSMFLNISAKSMKCPFVYQIQFDKARWSCSWNSDQNCITKLYQVIKRVMRVQGLAGLKGVGVYDSCENDLLSVI